MFKKVAITAAAVLISAFSSANADKPLIMVSIPPQAGIARAIAGDSADVESLTDITSDPHSFDPSQKRIVKTGGASVFFAAGLPFEENLIPKLRASFPSLTLKNTADGFPRRIDDEEDDDDGHDDHCHHGHDHGDPHTWISFEGVICHAGNITETLSALFPAEAPVYKARFEKLKAEIEAARKSAEAAFSEKHGAHILAYHPAYGYLAEELGLKQAAVEKHGGEPPLKHLMELSELVEKEHIKAVIVQNDSEAAKIKDFAKRHDLAILAIAPMSVCADAPGGISSPVGVFMKSLGIPEKSSAEGSAE